MLRLVHDGAGELRHGAAPGEAEADPSLHTGRVAQGVGEVGVLEGGQPRADLLPRFEGERGKVVEHELGQLPLEVPLEDGVAPGPGRDESGGVVHDARRAPEPGQVVRPVGDVARVAALDRVVVRVVGEDGDPAGPDARLDGERLVAPDGQVLGEAQLVLLHQLAAEELGVGEREGERRVVEADVGLVARVQLLVDVAPVGADHLADDHVGLVGVGAGDHAFQRLLTEVVVGPYEVDVPAGGQLQGTVARGRGPARIGLVDHSEDVRVLLREAVQFAAAVVGRSVVDRDDLQPVLADGLRHQGVQAFGEVRHGVVDGDDHRDVGCSGHLAVPRISRV
ncbi:hypothetical protein SCYAM73S_04150 [Streptomyces cyaneofuscatus]